MTPYTDPSTFPVNLTTLRDGDRVRATFRGDGLVVEGIVEGATDRPGGHRKIKGFDRRLARARSIEVLEKAPEPLPTKPGIYLPNTYTSPSGNTPNVWRLDSAGKWLEMPNLEGCEVAVLSELRVRDALSGMVYLGDGRDAPKATDL